jgi:hypothetical protein
MKGIKRPAATVLPDTAAVPPANIRTPPVHFTHEVDGPAPFWFSGAGAKDPDGNLRPGVQVILVSREGKYAWITDERGLHVLTPAAAIVPIA